ncbi:ankyrin repeat domain-containing protein 45-like isoform X2 [Oscarella lobularis]|uniref:ankyrin repeat domain-containing protein 45-like isoform X2 n=1 Tax=Oscarella lobularis TaxID=121494 RepID=UPI00331336D4
MRLIDWVSSVSLPVSTKRSSLPFDSFPVSRLIGINIPVAMASLVDFVARGDLDGMRECLDRGDDPLSCDEEHKNALDVAAVLGRFECLHEIFDRGVDVNWSSASGYTSLHRAAIWGHLHCVTSLVQSGADMSIRNRRGETAKDVAARYDQQDIVDFLDQTEARDSLKDAIQGIRGILSNADRIAGKWNKEDKSKTAALCNEKSSWMEAHLDATPHEIYRQKKHLEEAMQPSLTKLEPPVA